MSLKHLLFALAGVFVTTAACADTTFAKPEYRVTLPGEWKDTSDREADAFENAKGTREFTASFMSLKQPLDQTKLRGVLSRLLQLRAQAHRQLDGADTKFNGPTFSMYGRFTTAQLWGSTPRGRMHVTTLFADSAEIKSFSYLASSGEEASFRAEATKVLARIEFK